MHLHNYTLIVETKDAVKEICVECKERLLTKKGYKGAIDNRKYLKAHERDFIQISNPLFEKYYGKVKDFGKI